MLAVEHARRLADVGGEVLFVCFNRALVAHLRGARHPKGVHYHTFHGLCTHLARRAKVKLPQYPEGEAPQAFFEQELPEALVQAVDELGEAFDALIVDEAQDLRTDWLDALRYTLRDEPNAPIWLFLDDSQNVFDVELEIPPQFRPFDLTVNCRNTQAIHREVRKLYRGAVAAEALGPQGRPVEVHHTEDQPRTVAGVLERICGREEVAPQDVVVLSAHGYEKSAVAQAQLGRWTLARDPPKGRAIVRFSSIRAFKGLEAPVVLLCELEDIDEATRERQLYVGISRAKNHCVVVLPAVAP
jgi:superfamily I DNA/RNA helicase